MGYRASVEGAAIQQGQVDAVDVCIVGRRQVFNSLKRIQFGRFCPTSYLANCQTGHTYHRAAAGVWHAAGLVAGGYAITA